MHNISTYPPTVITDGKEFKMPEWQLDIKTIPDALINDIKYDMVEEDGWVKCKLYWKDICLDTNLLFRVAREQRT